MVVDCALPHFGEEPPISGLKGSGTIFFSSCNLRCHFCQNYQISQSVTGQNMSPRELAETMIILAQKGCHNINLVTPTPHAPFILDAIREARNQGLSLPIVYNTSGYELPEVIRELNGWIDIYMPDFKFGDEETAYTFAGVKNYTVYAKAALKEMINQVGEELVIQDGIATRGLIVRHLIFPGLVENSLKAIKIMAEELSPRLTLSIMSQYTPIPALHGHPLLGRRLTAAEYEIVVNYALDMGFENIYIQELDARHLMPDFRQDTPFAWYEREEGD
ncbi:MAG: radical SAM protein [Syntrophales bacterium]|nr:radical SAM protein [Syntrophales bacterium]